MHILALFMFIFHDYNMLYLLPTSVYVRNDVLSVLLWISSAFSCNRKWKLYLFLFIVCESYISQSNFYSQYLGAGSLSLCMVIYKNLIFETNSDNREYFIGFLVICITNTAQLFTKTLEIQLHYLLMGFIAVVSAILANMIFSVRINQIRTLELETLRDLSIMPKYIDQMLEDFKVPEKMKARLKIHSKNCKNVYCYCKNDQYRFQGEYYLYQMFENLMRRLGSLGDDQLWSYYIDFYLKRDQVLTAYYYLLKWKPTSYFSMISRLASEGRIESFL